MRPTGHATVDPRRPRAFGVCQRCNFWFNHDQLRWQYEFTGPRLTNLRLLVCESCLDKPQEQFKTIIIPADPIPIQNARPENFPGVDNPMSGIGMSPVGVPYSAQIGTLIQGGGLISAFDGATGKPFEQCAQLVTSDSSYGNYLGVNWTGYVNPSTPADTNPGTVLHVLSSYAVYAPSGTSFLGSTAATSWVIQGSSLGSSAWSDWTTLASGVTAGTAGESITGASTGTVAYQYHRFAMLGDGAATAVVAQVQFSVADVGQYT